MESRFGCLSHFSTLVLDGEVEVEVGNENRAGWLDGCVGIARDKRTGGRGSTEEVQNAWCV
jgi:hypothetical protein